MREEWRNIEVFEGYYMISNLGRVKSLERMKWNGRGYQKVPEKILKGRDNGHGYLRVNLCKEGKVKQHLVHVLVATAFLPNPDNLPEVNHKDENKQNNCVENLEWCSHSYNNKYNDKAKKVGKKRSKPVYSVDKESGLIMWWQSAHEAERCTGIPHQNIIKCCKGKLNSAGNHIWFYADDNE